MRYVFDSDAVDEAQRRIIEDLEALGHVRFQDTADADPGQKRQLYNNILSPLSIVAGKDLERFRSDDGGITYADGVLITPDTYYVGEEVADFLTEEG